MAKKVYLEKLRIGLWVALFSIVFVVLILVNVSAEKVDFKREEFSKIEVKFWYINTSYRYIIEDTTVIDTFISCLNNSYQGKAASRNLFHYDIILSGTTFKEMSIGVSRTNWDVMYSVKNNGWFSRSQVISIGADFKSFFFRRVIKEVVKNAEWKDYHNEH